MAIEVSVPQERVDEIRTLLDPLAEFPPTVGTNEKFPSLRLLKYDLPKDAMQMTMTALQNGCSVNRC